MQNNAWLIILLIVVILMFLSLKARRVKKAAQAAAQKCDPLPGEALPYARVRCAIGNAISAKGPFWATSSVHTQQTMLFAYLYQYVRYACAKRPAEVLEEQRVAGEAFAQDALAPLLVDRLLLRLIPEIEAPLDELDTLMRKCTAMDLSATSSLAKRSRLLEQERNGTALVAELLAWWTERREAALLRLRAAGQSAPDRDADKTLSTFPKTYTERADSLRKRLDELITPTEDTPHTSGEHLRYLRGAIHMAESCSRAIQAEMAQNPQTPHVPETLRCMTDAWFDTLAQYLNSKDLTWTLAKGEAADLTTEIPALFDQTKALMNELRKATLETLFDALAQFSPDFMETRTQPPLDLREEF